MTDDAIQRTPATPQVGYLRALDAAISPRSRRALSRREIEVLRLVAEGMTNEEIAKQLVIAHETVKAHVRKLLAKLDARTRAHAVAIGFQSQLLTDAQANRVA